MRLMQREKTVKTLDFFIKNKDLEGLCKTIDDFVLNPANKPPLPVVQNLSEQFQIPSHIKDIPPTDEAEMDGRRNLLTLGCEAAVVYRQYKHMFWKNQDLLFDLLRKLQSDMMQDACLCDGGNGVEQVTHWSKSLTHFENIKIPIATLHCTLFR